MKMIAPSNVQLTKVFYYDKNKSHRNMEIPSVSREVCRSAFDKNTIIKKNVFGHTWVLRINETAEPKVKDKCDAKIILYVWVFCCIIVAISFGIYFSLESKYSKTETELTSRFVPKQMTNRSLVLDEDDKNADEAENIEISERSESQQENSIEVNETMQFEDETSNKIICNECNPQDEICLKIEEAEPPRCVKFLDPKDPTGCGGLCKINVQHCRLLDIDAGIYQCTRNKNVLLCRGEEFNCGNRCIAKEKRCDGIFHCTNYSDEENCQCDLNKNFHCGNNTSCLPLAKKCDGFVDCWDKSDEVDCTKMSACNEHESPCHNGECIKKEKFCDGTHDCSDKSDEPQGCLI